MAHVARRAKQTNRIVVFIGRFFAILGVTALAVILLFFGILYLLCKGPSPAIRDLFVTTATESGTWDLLPRVLLSDEEIDAILNNNRLDTAGAVTDPDGTFAGESDTVSEEAIELLDITGPTYTGKLLIVHDPSRLSLATIPVFDEEIDGNSVKEFADIESAIAAVPAGLAVSDGLPSGFVIRNGALLYGESAAATSAVAVDENGRLIVGTFSPSQAIQWQIRDAVSAGPALIINGEPVMVYGNGSGLAPRTVIGQREDGVLLLLTVDGDPFGATYKGCLQVMLQCGAVNAAVLNSESATMIYNGDTLCDPTDHCVPTAFIIR